MFTFIIIVVIALGLSIAAATIVKLIKLEYRDIKDRLHTQEFRYIRIMAKLEEHDARIRRRSHNHKLLMDYLGLKQMNVHEEEQKYSYITKRDDKGERARKASGHRGTKKTGKK
jgi:uncharacterized protein YdcH (DUF465 family)